MHGDNAYYESAKNARCRSAGTEVPAPDDDRVHTDDGVHTEHGIHPADRPAPCVPKVSRLKADDRRLLLQHRDVGEIAVLLAVVEAVADDEMVLDRESDILHAHVDLAA
jgi:hypothetical protein